MKSVIYKGQKYVLAAENENTEKNKKAFEDYLKIHANVSRYIKEIETKFSKFETEFDDLMDYAGETEDLKALLKTLKQVSFGDFR